MHKKTAVRLGKWEGPIRSTICINMMQQHVLGSLPPQWEIWSKIPRISSTSCSQTSLHGKQEHIKPRALWPSALVWAWDVATEQHMTWHLRSAYASATCGAVQVIWTRGSLSLRAEPNKDRSLVSGKSGAEIKRNRSFLLLQAVQASECQQHVWQLPAALAFNSIVLKCQTGSLPLA